MVALLLVQLLAANGPAPAARAAQLTGLANEDFAHGRYGDAAQEYQQADRLAPRPALLLKVAQCYEKAGDLSKAADAYRSYLQRAPGAPNRGTIKKKLARLTKQLSLSGDALAIAPLAPSPSPGGPSLEPLVASSGPALEPLAPAAPAPAPAPAPPEPPPPHEVVAQAPAPPPPAAEATAEAPHKPLAPILVTTGGAVAVVLAGASAYWGGWGLDALSTSQTNQKNAPAAEKSKYNGEISQYELQAGVWLSVAAVLAAGGIYLLVAGPSWGSHSSASSDSTPSSSSVSIAPMQNGGGLVWSGSFP